MIKIKEVKLQMNISEQEFINYVKELNDNLLTTEIAKIYGFSSEKFNQILQESDVIYKRKYNGKYKWILKKNFQRKGLQEIKRQSYIKSNGEILTFHATPKWTKKGILYLYYLLKERNIYPKFLNKDEIEEKLEQLSFI